MLTPRGYRTCLGLIRQRFGKTDETGCRTLPTILNGGLTPMYVPLTGLDEPALEAIELIYLPRNMYIMGYRAAGSVTVFQTTTAVINATSFLNFGPSYIAMNWNKNIDDTTVSFTDLTAALWAISGGAPVGEAQMRAVVIAFAEGLRFFDVEQAVIDGGHDNITNAMVDWNNQIAAGHARLRQG